MFIVQLQSSCSACSIMVCFLIGRLTDPEGVGGQGWSQLVVRYVEQQQPATAGEPAIRQLLQEVVLQVELLQAGPGLQAGQALQ